MLSPLLRASRLFFLLGAICGLAAAGQLDTPPKTPPPESASKPPVALDYSKEALVFETIHLETQFESDGTGTHEESARVRVQSQSAVEQLGVLKFQVLSKSDRFELLFARVRKRDGTIVETPASAFQEVTPQVTQEAPTYSDTRELQLPVKGISVGDVLEYAARWRTVEPIVKGHFWTEYQFRDDAVILDRRVSISVPATKYVQVSSPKQAPVVSQAQGRKTYQWSVPSLTPTAGRANGSNEDAGAENNATDVLIRVTTFHDWEEMGQWYRGLAEPRAAATPAIRAKTEELTHGLTTGAEKQRAIYAYVSTQIRYISLSFGAGRYEPHSADEVLSNRYGDCKDKHTLLAALLKAAGYPAWPVLIGANIEFDPAVPIPSQFNHLITALPAANGEIAFLDSTSGVTPFGSLLLPTRDQEALVIPSSDTAGKPYLQKTPARLPFPSTQDLQIIGTLSKEDVFDGHFDLTLRGDVEFVLRGLLRQIAPAQWKEFAQGFMGSLGYSGEVRAPNIENVNNPDLPLHLAFDYHREDYPGLKTGKMPSSLPMGSGLVIGDKPKPGPAKKLKFGDPHIDHSTAVMKLPDGFALTLEPDVNLTNAAGSYTSHYALQAGTLSVDRTLNLKQPKVQVETWDDLKALADASAKDAAGEFTVTAGESGKPSIALRSDPSAHDAVMRAYEALQNKRFSEAVDALGLAEKLNPAEAGLWAEYGWLHEMQGNLRQASEDYRKEAAHQPGNTMVAWTLVQIQERLGQHDDEIQTLRALLKAAPQDQQAPPFLANLLIEKNPAEALEFIESWTKVSPGNSTLLFDKGRALLALGKPGEAIETWKQDIAQDPTERQLNSVGYALADDNLRLDLAKEYTSRAVQLSEAALKDLTIDKFDREKANEIASLASFWDSLGWAYFRLDQNYAARRYLDAAWTITQRGEVADHLGQLSEKLGHKTEAAHMYRLALAADPKLEKTRTRLDRLGIPGSHGPQTAPKSADGRVAAVPKSLDDQIRFAEELGKLRTSPVPSLTLSTGSAEFLVLETKNGVEDVKFVSGEETLRSAAPKVAASGTGIKFPDSGDEKLVRRGILSCSQYTAPRCNFTVYLPQNSVP